MRIYVSSTFRDLESYRGACIRVLRQLGHEVVSMEDYVAEASIPVDKVVADVKSCDLYVVLVAWRYGYIPTADRITVDVAGAVKGQTSITDYEYLAAGEAGKKRIAFLVHEHAPWPPNMMDGFDSSSPSGRGDLSKVLAFREKIQKDLMVAYFKEPSDLEARISAAVASVGLRSQMMNNSMDVHNDPALNAMSSFVPISDSGRMPLQNLVTASPSPEVALIDIGTTWWSTRLYLLAVVAEFLTDVRRIVVTERGQFVGIVSPGHVRATLRAMHPEIDQFEQQKLVQPLPNDPVHALSVLLASWREVIKQPTETDTLVEQSIQITVTRAALIRWLSDGFWMGAVRVLDPDQTTVLDLLRVLDYPNQYVPLVAESSGNGSAATPTSIRIINKATLNAQLAKNYIDDTLTSLGLRLRRS
jgi:hypothetical protein